MARQLDTGDRLRRLAKTLRAAASDCDKIAAALEGRVHATSGGVREAGDREGDGTLVQELSRMTPDELDTQLPLLRVSDLERLGQRLGVAFRVGKTPKAELVRLVKAGLRWDARMGVVGRGSRPESPPSAST